MHGLVIILETIGHSLWESWQVLGEMGPYLLFGFAMAGLLSLGLSPAWTERHLGGRGIRPVLAASLLGVPLPLCSCAVIPVAAAMRRHGAKPRGHDRLPHLHAANRRG